MTPFTHNLSIETKKMRLGCEHVQAAHKIIGSPASSFSSIHVAGTNGKGSVSFKIYLGLKKAGKRVGLFSSPHLQCPTERIVVNGRAIPKARLQTFFSQLEEVDPDLTYFERMTLSAFLYFKEEKVEYAVVEVGIGGRLDATNIIHPILSVITSIGWDHMQWLGDTLEKIAFEKGGIIKERVPVVVGQLALHGEVLQSIANSRRAPLFQVATHQDYELENRAIAAKALELLNIEQVEIKQSPLCRFMEVKDIKPLILDVAHNLPGVAALLRKAKAQYPSKSFAAILGLSKDKQTKEILELIQNECACTLPLAFSQDRSLFTDTPSFEQQLEKGQQIADVVLVFGSFFIFPEVLATLQKRGVELSFGHSV